MDFIRELFDEYFLTIRDGVFRKTKGNPKLAHKKFVDGCATLKRLGLAGLVLDHSSNYNYTNFELSNAAGLNKDAEFHPEVLEHMGFDRVVVGTVTYDPWKGNGIDEKGNPVQTVWRYPETNSMVNFEGLPGIGAREVEKRLLSYGSHGVPLTINFMSTPKKQGKGLLNDLEKTILTLRDVPYVSRFELNISCPNTDHNRSEYMSQLNAMLDITDKRVRAGQEIYLKVSPDLDEHAIDEIIEVASRHRVHGFTTTNTTTEHDERYISESPGKGGASGDAVYYKSLKVQQAFNRRIADDKKLIAVGGIDSQTKLKERLTVGAKGIQIYTPLIFQGTKIVRELRSA